MKQKKNNILNIYLFNTKKNIAMKKVDFNKIIDKQM